MSYEKLNMAEGLGDIGRALRELKQLDREDPTRPAGTDQGQPPQQSAAPAAINQAETIIIGTQNIHR